jgi:glycolate oxidase FAD binding subunit
MTVTVEAGLTLSALQALLARENQRLPLDVPDPDHATVGGVFATNTSGPRRFGAGRPRDLLIGVSFVTSEGALVKGGGRVVKNVAGYDFPRLLTGSLGTLGVITQVTLKVRPRPETSSIVWVKLREASRLASALDGLNTSNTRPVSVELLNAPAAAHVGASAGLEGADWVLAVGFEDNARSVAWQVDRLRAELRDFECHLCEGASTEPLWAALTQFQADPLGPVCLVANLKPSTVASYVCRFDPARWSVQAHAGNGIVRAHAFGPWELEAIATEIDRLRALAVADGGNLVLSRCPAVWKATLKVWGEPRADWGLAQRIKRALDPRGVLNPGRFVGTI